MDKQLSLFDTRESRLVSPAQRRIAAENPYYNLFGGKSLVELGATDQTIGKTYFNLFQHPLLEAFWAAQTVALEKHLESLDERFLLPYQGAFNLRLDEGTDQRVDFEYEPDYKPHDKPRTTPPQPCVRFSSENPSPLSFSGFLHHPMDSLPFNQVGTMEDLIRLIVRQKLAADTAEIVFL